LADIEEVIKTRVSLEQEFRRHHGLRVRLEGRMEVREGKAWKKGREEGYERRMEGNGQNKRKVGT
jgi:hypothetical protein